MFPSWRSDCLELEQQLLACQTELAKHSAEAENITLTLPQLFYDTGSGFSPWNV